MLVSKVKDIISNFGLDWNPLARPINVHNIYPESIQMKARDSILIL